MSTRIKVTHWLICDWEDCKASVVTSYETSEGDTYHNIPPEGWEKIDGKDYCPKHWHRGGMFKDAITPGPEEQKPEIPDPPLVFRR